jgi:hypothetical protein
MSKVDDFIKPVGAFSVIASALAVSVTAVSMGGGGSASAAAPTASGNASQTQPRHTAPTSKTASLSQAPTGTRKLGIDLITALTTSPTLRNGSQICGKREPASRAGAKITIWSDCTAA